MYRGLYLKLVYGDYGVNCIYLLIGSGFGINRWNVLFIWNGICLGFMGVERDLSWGLGVYRG